MMTALGVQEWGVDSKAVCAVLLSDLLRFFLPLLLPCANMEERRGERERDGLRRRHKKGGLGAKKRFGGYSVIEGGRREHLIPTRKLKKTEEKNKL